MFPSSGPNPTPQSMNYTVVINCAVWGGALTYYFVDARKWFTGPKITVDTEGMTVEQQEALEKEGVNLGVGEGVVIGGAHEKTEGQAREKGDSGIESA
jgi:hypothetical protein